MFELVNLDEKEFMYNPAVDKSVIKFSKFGEWLHQVTGAANAKYLKCITRKGTEAIMSNVADVAFSENLLYPKTGETFAAAVKVVLTEGSEAMTVGALRDKIGVVEQLIADAGIKAEDVRVLSEDQNKKLTAFCWFYDDEQETALVVKNMPPSAARKYLAGNLVLPKKVAAAAKSPTGLEQLPAYDEAALAKASAEFDAQQAQNDFGDETAM